jgi:hypothetical protein
LKKERGELGIQLELVPPGRNRSSSEFSEDVRDESTIQTNNAATNVAETEKPILARRVSRRNIKKRKAKRVRDKEQAHLVNRWNRTITNSWI